MHVSTCHVIVLLYILLGKVFRVFADLHKVLYEWFLQTAREPFFHQLAQVQLKNMFVQGVLNYCVNSGDHQ